MRRLRYLTAPFLFIIFFSSATIAQTTSWKGTYSTSWALSYNWTNGVPTAAIGAIIGDANFTGANQPTISVTATCKSLTIGGTVSSVLTIKSTTTASGNIQINGNGSIVHTTGTITLTGNWVNNGSYSATGTGCIVLFGGTTESIQGTAVTTFRRITINAGSVTTLAANVTVSGLSSILTVKGTLNPAESPTYKITGTALTVNSAAILKVTGAVFTDNYTMSGTVTFSAGSIVEYSATSTNQTISSLYTYSTLTISGSGTKSLAANLPTIRATASTYGNIYVNAGILDLGAYTATRGTTVTGGTIAVASGCTLKIGGTNGFPANYATASLSLSSTVEYDGTAQSVAAKTYGNLILSSSTGSVVKTMPATALTIAGNFRSDIGAGSGVTYTAASNISVSGSVTIGASTVFNGGTFSHALNDDWINNGTFTGATSTVTFGGGGSIIGGSGANNFYNLTVSATGISSPGTTAISVAGNFATTGPGIFTHQSGGVFTMSGTSKTISGTGISLDNVTVTGTITTASTLPITGSLSVAGSFIASVGTITMSGTSKTISGAGTIGFHALQLSGSITCTSNFSVASSLDVSGSFTATAGIATFTATATLNGTANLFNVVENGTSLVLSSNAVLGVASTLTMTAGTLNVTTNKPNTVAFNGTTNQTVNALTYHHLLLTNGNTKTAGGAITVNGNLSIGASTIFAGSSSTHTLLGNWINGGTFTPGTSTIQMTGAANASISGATTFNVLTINKTAATNVVTLLSNVSVPLINMTVGSMQTGANAITITNDRSGPGIILGTITRTHSFSSLSTYAFEGPDNTIAFTVALGVTSVTVQVTVGTVSDYPNGEAINRVYNISVPSGTYTGTLRLHYEDAELNGNTESSMQLAHYNGSSWTTVGKTGNSTTANYVELMLQSNITNRWTCSGASAVVRWNGGTSSDWNTAANWTVVSGAGSRPPSANDIVQIGTAAFTNQPTISTAATVKNLVFGSIQASTLTLTTGGTLTTSGNISGSWSTNATHNINVGNQTMTVNGDLLLSDGTTGHAINLSIGTGSVVVSGVLQQSGAANITYGGAGNISVKGDFTSTSGSFTPSTGTFTYNGTGSQDVAGVTYNNLTIAKTSGRATANAATTIAGNLAVTTGEMDFNATTTVTGNVTIGFGTTIYGDGTTINVAGDWSNSGLFSPGAGTVVFNGTGAQSIGASPFNILTINKSSGTATLSGNASISSNLSVLAGTLGLSTYTANRGTNGGIMTIASGATLNVAGANNFPQNFGTYAINSASVVNYNGTVAQSVVGVTYGNLSFTNAGAKSMLSSITVNGDLTINGGASLDEGAYNVNLAGNWINSGTFVPSTGIVVLNGTAKTITGATTFNRVTVYGSYTVAGSNITYNGLLNVTVSGSFAAGSGTATVNGDLTNNGTLTSTGTTTFTGTTVQTIHLINALVSTSTGIVNFNGTVSPILNSTSMPTFFNLNINNTGGVNPSVNWLVLGTMTIGSGGIFNGGQSLHTIKGAFTNNGTVTSSGTIDFEPASTATVKLSGTNFSSTGIVIFGGTGAMTVTGTPTALYDVRITNKHASGITPPSGWSIGNDFVVNSDASFIAGSYSYTVGGDIEIDGTLDGGTSTFTMSGAANQITGSPNTTFNHFTITGNISANSDFNVAGNFFNNGAYDGTEGVLTMTGGNGATIGGTTTPSTIAQLTIAKNANVVVTMTGAVSEVLSLFINSGTLSTGTYAITQDASGGLLYIADDATLKLGGTNSLPGFSAYALDTYSTVDYAGTTQLIGNAASYGNLTISGAGTKNAVAPLVAMNNFTITAGTVQSAVTVTHAVGGNWLMTGGTFNNTSSTILLNGTGDQDVSSTANFYNLNITKSSGQVTLSSNVTVTATLNLSSGKVVLGAYNLSMGASGSITNAGNASYVVAIGNGVVSQNVSAGGTKTFPVGLSSYYMPASVSLTAGSTADVISMRMFPAVYHEGISGKSATNYAVNATWMISEAVAGGSNASISVQWPAALELAGFNRTISRLAHFTNSLWDFGPADINATGANPYTVSRSGFTTFSAFGVSTFMALPVTWLGISGYNNNDNNYINWSVAQELNNDHFEIERSADGIHFTSIGYVRGAGSTPERQDYSFVDRNVSEPVYYYRIKQVDNDARATYSKTLVIRSTAGTVNTVTILSNPVVGDMTVSISSRQVNNATVQVVDASGRSLYQQKLRIAIGSTLLQVPDLHQSAGMYYLVLLNDDGTKTVRNFVIR